MTRRPALHDLLTGAADGGGEEVPVMFQIIAHHPIGGGLTVPTPVIATASDSLARRAFDAIQTIAPVLDAAASYALTVHDPRAPTGWREVERVEIVRPEQETTAHA